MPIARWIRKLQLLFIHYTAILIRWPSLLRLLSNNQLEVQQIFFRRWDTTPSSALKQMVYVLLRYPYAHPGVSSIGEVYGGSPRGAGTFSGEDNWRKVTDLEIDVFKTQGAHFQKITLDYNRLECRNLGYFHFKFL